MSIPSDAAAVLRFLGHYQLSKNEDSEEYEYVTSRQWNFNMIRVKYSNYVGENIDTIRLHDALGYLERRNMVFIERGQWWITGHGEEANRDAREHPELHTNDQTFKNEVLTGMTSGGKRTKIVSPVLPTKDRRK